MARNYSDEVQGITIPDLDLSEKKSFIDARMNVQAQADFYNETINGMIDDYEDDPKNSTPISILEKAIDKKFEELYIEGYK